MKVLYFMLIFFIIFPNSISYSSQSDVINVAVNGTNKQLIDILKSPKKSFILRKKENLVYDARDYALYFSLHCKRLDNAETLIKHGAKLKNYSWLECNQANKSNILKEIIREEKSQIEDEGGVDPFLNVIFNYDKGKVDLNILDLLFRNDKWYCSYESTDLGGSYYDSLVEEIKNNKNSEAKKQLKIFNKYCK